MEKCTSYTLFTINFFLSFLFASFYVLDSSVCHWKVRFSHWNNKSYMRFYEARRISLPLRPVVCALSYSFFYSWWDVYGRLTSNLSRCKNFLFIISVFRQQYSVALSNSLHLLWFFPFLECRCLHLSIIAIFCSDIVNTGLFRAQGTSHSFLLCFSSLRSLLSSWQQQQQKQKHKYTHRATAIQLHTSAKTQK